MNFIVSQTFDEDISEDIVGVIRVSATGWAGYGELANAGLTAEASPETANCLVSILLYVTQLDSGDHGILLLDSKLLYSFQYLTTVLLARDSPAFLVISLRRLVVPFYVVFRRYLVDWSWY